MHDETAGGQAVKDRALAYWTDPHNFSTSHDKPKRNRLNKNARFILGMGLAFGIQHFI